MRRGWGRWRGKEGNRIYGRPERVIRSCDKNTLQNRKGASGNPETPLELLASPAGFEPASPP